MFKKCYSSRIWDDAHITFFCNFPNLTTYQSSFVLSKIKIIVDELKKIDENDFVRGAMQILNIPLNKHIWASLQHLKYSFHYQRAYTIRLHYVWFTIRNAMETGTTRLRNTLYCERI